MFRELNRDQMFQPCYQRSPGGIWMPVNVANEYSYKDAVDRAKTLTERLGTIAIIPVGATNPIALIINEGVFVPKSEADDWRGLYIEKLKDVYVDAYDIVNNGADPSDWSWSVALDDTGVVLKGFGVDLDKLVKDELGDDLPDT